MTCISRSVVLRPNSQQHPTAARFASRRSRWADGTALERRLAGVPTLIVYDGQVMRHQMRRELVSADELHAALRERGLSSVKQAKMVVLEVDGSITVVVDRPSADKAGPA